MGTDEQPTQGERVKESWVDTIDLPLSEIAKDLGLNDRFFSSLIEEPDDWSFLVKCHALLEAITCNWLVAYFGKDELQQVFAKMQMRTKIDILDALNLTTKEDRKMMRALGTLRNKLVHNVQNTNFTFEEYFEDPVCLDSFRQNFVIGEGDGEDMEQYRLAVKAFPRKIIWLCIVFVASYSFEEKKLHTFIQDAQREASLQWLQSRVAGKKS